MMPANARPARHTALDLIFILPKSANPTIDSSR